MSTLKTMQFYIPNITIVVIRLTSIWLTCSRLNPDYDMLISSGKTRTVDFIPPICSFTYEIPKIPTSSPSKPIFKLSKRKFQLFSTGIK